MTSVQAFFAIVLGLALLAYVIVILMGLLQTQSKTMLTSDSGTVTNETGGSLSATGYTLGQAGLPGFASPSITRVVNATDGQVIGSGNYTLTSNKLYNATEAGGYYNTVKVSYTYTSDSVAQAQARGITGNTSTGITGFFGSISPVYAILAVLVIILVLVVLVRVVTGGTMGMQRESSVPL